MAEYENKLKLCSFSGFHGNLENVDEAKFGNTLPTMRYLHEHMKEFPSLLDMALVILPPDSFSQSASGAPAGGNTRAYNRRSDNNTTSSGVSAVLHSITEKNAAVLSSTLIQNNSNLYNQGKEAKSDT